MWQCNASDSFPLLIATSKQPVIICFILEVNIHNYFIFFSPWKTYKFTNASAIAFAELLQPPGQPIPNLRHKILFLNKI